MRKSKDATIVAMNLAAEIEKSTAQTKRLKLRTLLKKFGYISRSDKNTGEITQRLSEAHLTLNPPIVRFGEDWGSTLDDWVYLSIDSPKLVQNQIQPCTPQTLPQGWNSDGWVDRIATMELRTEKEVEIKFIVPLLYRLGYGDDDRYDGMPVPAASGSRKTTLVIDFALFNHSLDLLQNQPLLTVEAKREGRLVKKQEIEAARNQAKSYCLWTQCDFFMVTDSKNIQIYATAARSFESIRPIFECLRHELPERFVDLYACVSKEALTQHYLKRRATIEELT